MNRRGREAAERFQERRRREDEAPRLLRLFPKLVSLRFQLTEHRSDDVFATVTHARLIIVATAPALFVFNCLHATCLDGGHDVTLEVCAALRNGRTLFAGDHQCRGLTGSSECTRVLRYVANAGYAE